MDNSLFSVIIPSYNPDLKLIQRAVISILQADDSKDVEVILVYSNIQQNVKEYFESLNQDKRVILIENLEIGVSKSRNIGLNRASGEYIVFLDSDDFVCSDIFSQLKKQLYDSPDIILYGFEKFVKNTHHKIIPYYHGDLFDYVTSGDGGGLCWNKCFRNGYIKEHDIHFPENLSLAEDLLFVLQAASFHPKVKIIDKVLVNYFVTPNSISQGYSPDTAKIYTQAMNELVKADYIEEPYLSKIIMNHLFYSFLKKCYHPMNGGFKIGTSELKQILEEEPYKNAMKTVSYDQFSRSRQMILFCLRHRLYIILFLIAKLYQHRNF